MRIHTYSIFFFSLLFLSNACENSEIPPTTKTGIETGAGIILSDESVSKIAKRSAAYTDQTLTIAPPRNPYARRLIKLVGDRHFEDGVSFNFKVYLSDEVNAFAMADGTIRIYSGLMDILDNEELRFVIGHEMGHVAHKHTHSKFRLAYAENLERKGESSTGGDENNTESRLGIFAETVTNAGFSQLEEREADDYGLLFMKNKGYDQIFAVSALQKLATLGESHAFIAKHPSPAVRAEHLSLLLGKKPETGRKFKLVHKLKDLTSSLYIKFYEIGRAIKDFF